MCHQPMVAYTWLLHQLLPGIFLLPFLLASIFHLLPFPPSLLPTTVSQLYFPQLHHSIRFCCWNSQFLTTTTKKKIASGSSTAALPFLLPLGEWGAGRGDWDHKHRCISGQSCCCAVSMDAFQCMWYGPSSTLW